MQTWRLVVETATGSRELLFIGQMTAGRVAECDISLDDGKVSRRHASFDATGPTPRVTDLNSRNGILVNNRRVSTADLVDGDVVVIGDAKVRLELIAEASQPDTAPATAGALQAHDVAAAAGVEDDRTAVLPRPVASGRSVPAAPTSSAVSEDATAVLRPPPSGGRHVPLPPVAARVDARPPGAGAAPANAPSVVPVAAALDVPVPDVAPPTPPPPSPLAAQYVAEAPAPAAAAARPAETGGPWLSWSAVVTLASLALALLAVALTALPLLSASREAVDDLGRRQARTLAAWLAGSVAPGDPPSRLDASLQQVLGQPGVQDGLVLDLATRRVVAPSRLAAETRRHVGEAGDWAAIAQPEVLVGSGVIDAYTPRTVGPDRYMAWVRYEVPTSRDRAFVVLAAVLGSLLMAVAAATWIRRRTALALSTFTRQVEIAVSGGDPRAMQGTLLPGLDKLPPVVAYLLEQRKAGFGAGRRGLGPLAVTDAEQPTPSWIEMTPALTVVSTSPHAPPFPVRVWGSAAADRHLLDVLEPGPVCNAVVMGLSGLAPAAGSEVAVSVDGHARPMVLRREASGPLRLTIPPAKAGRP